MIDIKRLSGILNLDDRMEDVLQHQHVQALNLRFYGGSNGLTAENIVGNTLVANSLLPSGSNEAIGGFYDGVKQRIIWGNWNSDGKHGIYQYSIETGLITRVIECFINSQTDILGFDRDFPMCDADIIYTTDIDGDIFSWNCRNKRPKCINLLQAENNTYGSNWLEEYLDVAKEPPFIPIKCAYENDATVTVNNLRKKLFKFKYRYWYSDNQKSTWSSHSEIPVPFNYTNPQTDTDETKNCRIGIVVQTGDASVVKVEIAACQNEKNIFSNFFSVIILDKSDLVIPNNDVYLWRFYNNEAYDYVELQESLLLFDRVPDKANCQGLLNGNVRIYGGITEGLDPVVPNVNITVGSEYPLRIPYTFAYSVTQYGTNGFVIGNSIKFVVIGTIRTGQTFIALIAVGVTVYTITYTAVLGDTTTEVLIGLSASATGQGFTQSSINANELVIIRSNQSLLRYYNTTTDQSISASFIFNTPSSVTIVNGAGYISLFTKGVIFVIYGNTLNQNPLTVLTSIVLGANLLVITEQTTVVESITTTLYFVPTLNSSIPAYNSSSKENLCLFYFEDKGKSNGATTRLDFNATTNPLDVDISVHSILYNTPYIQAEINHRPPLWATTYQWGRSLNLTKESYLFWVTSSTYKDDKYAYISIESIKVYKRLNPNSIISYDFLPGDRIKFYVLYDQEGNAVRSYSNEHDYEIYDVIVNPEIFDVVKTGTFVKIVLPTVDALFNFGTAVVVSPSPAQDFNNYYIELYTPAKAASEGLEVYYEFGEEYGIIDAGTATRCHQGQTQNQSTDLVIPAAFKFDKGDAWYRTRTVQVGNIIIYDLFPGISFGSGTILGQRLRSIDFTNPDYAIEQDINQQPFVNNFASPGWTINVLANTYTFRVKGIITLVANNSTSTAPRVQAYVLTSPSTTVTYLLGGYTGVLPITTGQEIVFNVNTNIIMPPNSKVFIVMNSGDGNWRCSLLSGYLNYTEPKKEFTIGVVDQNFSDFYESKVNSNGRPQKVNPDEKTNFFGTLVRWGLSYQQNTNINQINRFPDDNFDEVDRAKGDIQRLKARDRILRVFQNLAVGQYGVSAKYIQSNNDDPNLVATNTILTKSNIAYYEGHYGLGTEYTNLVSAANVDYGVYPVTGDQWRLSNDGFTPISMLYKGEFTIKNLLTPYNKQYLRSNGATAKILGCYNYFDNEYIALLQGGTNGSSTIESYAFSFNEKRNGYSSFFDYKTAEWILSAEDTMVAWKEGQMYLHNNTTNRCNFFGQQFGCSITLVFNINLLEVKTWESVSEIANAVWNCPLIWTSTESYAGQRQESKLIDAHFANLEGQFKTAFRRDLNSRGGLYNGDTLKGDLIVIKFQIDNASNLVTLSAVTVMSKDSPLNTK